MGILKKAFNERNLVVILFAMVLVTFSFAQKESKKLEKIYYGVKIKEASPYVSAENSRKNKIIPPEMANPSSN